MIRSLSFAVALALGAAAAPSVSSAQSAPAVVKPLRTLVYSVQFTAKTTNEEHGSGLSSENGAQAAGSATTRRTSNVDDSGTLTASVVAAPSDGGLVIDTSFTGKSANQPAIRVAVYPDGRLTYAPGADLSPEAARLLPLLARGIVADRDVSPGSSWTIAAPAPLHGAYTYHVSAVDGDTATFGIDVDMSAPGPKGFDEHGKATAKYDTKRLCPTQFDYTGTARHQPAMDQYVTTTARLTATLVS
ncbi:MAG: hypothetical protein QOD51_2525, partial [Candidatus Eremiobacteraeota bacterium]|nr:hypothetical protein [Candidatus Eremiobacteraeota bacterium]